MPELEDDILDGLMRQHLSAELDGQLGRSEAAFRRHLQLAAAEPTRAGRPGLRRGGRLFAILGTGLAACVAGLLIAPRVFHHPTGGPVEPGPTQPAVASQSPTVHFVQSRTFDEGTVIRDGAPFRKVRRVQLDQTRWSDVDGRWELTVPHEDVQYMELDPY